MGAAKPRGAPAVRKPLRSLLRLLLLQPVWAVPFASFFGLLYGEGWIGFLRAYRISLVFAYTVALFIWVAEHFLQDWLIPPQGQGGKKRILRYVALYGTSAILGSYAGATIVHFTLVPGFMGSPRMFALNSMFTLLFVVMVMALIFAVQFYREAIAKARADEELNLARRIQRSFLLSQFPARPRLEVHAENVSSKEVSGDFYDVVAVGDDVVYVAIADVAGKGVPAALLCSMLQASLRTQAGLAGTVAGMVGNMNALIYRSTAVHQFATFFLARIDERSLRMSYCNAGHNFPVLFRDGAEPLTLRTGGTVVGILEAADYDEDTVALAPGDRIVLYSDGITEAANRGSEHYGEERLNALVVSLPRELPARELTARILEDVRAHLGGLDPGDDMTVMAVRVV